MIINHKVLGQGPPLIILHGVFGSLDNWISVGRKLSEKFQVILTDARNHGQSTHESRFDFDSMAEDIDNLLDHLNIESAHILGHSMGGKTAIRFAHQNSARTRSLTVVDIAPRPYPPHHQKIFEAFHSVNLAEVKSRNDADQQMQKVIPEFGVRQFLLKNLSRTEQGHFRWKLNLLVIEKSIANIGAGFETTTLFDGKTLFIKGEKSDYINDADIRQISTLFPDSRIVTLKGAGHWVHADRPDELVKTVESFLSKV